MTKDKQGWLSYIKFCYVWLAHLKPYFWIQIQNQLRSPIHHPIIYQYKFIHCHHFLYSYNKVPFSPKLDCTLYRFKFSKLCAFLLSYEPFEVWEKIIKNLEFDWIWFFIQIFTEPIRYHILWNWRVLILLQMKRQELEVLFKLRNDRKCT